MNGVVGECCAETSRYLLRRLMLWQFAHGLGIGTGNTPVGTR